MIEFLMNFIEINTKQLYANYKMVNSSVGSHLIRRYAYAMRLSIWTGTTVCTSDSD